MTQAELNREVAALTGETVRTINRRGFSLQMMPNDDELDSPPSFIDWDEFDASRERVHPR